VIVSVCVLVGVLVSATIGAVSGSMINKAKNICVAVNTLANLCPNLDL
jgi:hypothetical protein